MMVRDLCVEANYTGSEGEGDQLVGAGSQVLHAMALVKEN